MVTGTTAFASVNQNQFMTDPNIYLKSIRVILWEDWLDLGRRGTCPISFNSIQLSPYPFFFFFFCGCIHMLSWCKWYGTHFPFAISSRTLDFTSLSGKSYFSRVYISRLDARILRVERCREEKYISLADTKDSSGLGRPKLFLVWMRDKLH